MNKKNFSLEQISYIIEKYTNKEKSCTVLGKEFSCDTETISKLLKDNGIEIKDHRILEFTTEQEQYIINEYNNGKSSVDLGKEFKCSDNVIARLLNKNGITLSKSKNITDNDIKVIIENYTIDNISLDEICSKFGIPRARVSKILTSNGIEVKNKLVKTFSEDDIKNIIKMYTVDFLSLKKIGEKYGCSKSVIGNLLKKNNIEVYDRNLKQHLIDDETVCNEHINGSTITEIAKKHNSTDTVITAILKKNNVEIINHRNYNYSDNEIKELIRLYTVELKTSFELAELFDCTVVRVNKILNENNIDIIRQSPVNKKSFNQEDTNKIIDLFYSKTKTFDEIGKQFDCSGDVISRILNESGIDTSRTIKLTNEQIKNICDDYVINNIGSTTLAKKYGFSSSFIGKILKENNVMQSRRIPTLTIEEELEIIKKHTEQDMTLYQISKEIGINDYYISENIFKKHNVKFKQKTPARDKLNIELILQELKDGKPVSRIAKENNSSFVTINNIAIENGIKSFTELTETYDEKYHVNKIDKKYSFNEFQKEFVIKKYKENYPVKSISNFFKVDYTTIHKILTDNDITVINSRIVLFSEEQETNICSEYVDNNKTILEIGKMYGTSQSVIRRILGKHNVEITNNYYSSVNENKIRYILGYFIPTIHKKSDCDNILQAKEIDIIDYTKKIGIEYNGTYFHRSENKSDTYHIDKTKEASAVGYKLYHVFDDEYVHDSVKIINRLLKLFKTGLYITEDTYDELEECFFSNTSYDEIYIEGLVKTKLPLSECTITKAEPTKQYYQFYTAFGLLKSYDETINNVNYNIEHKEYGLIGYISINKTTNTVENLFIEDDYVITGLNKTIFDLYLNEFKPTELFIEIDRRYASEPENLSDLSFELINETDPRVHYFKNYSRYIATNETNLELDSDVEWNIIHDCGTWKYKLNN